MTENTNRNINDIIVQRIQASFGELMGEDEWRDLVAAEITKFKTQERRYGDLKDSPLQMLVRKEIESELLKKIRETLASPNYQITMNNNTPAIVGELIKTIITENADAMLKNLMASIAASLIQQFSFQLNERMRNI